MSHGFRFCQGLFLSLAVASCGCTPASLPDDAAAPIPPDALRFSLALYATGTGPGAVAVRDLDADGAPDLLVANQDTLSLLRNAGDGTFPPARTLTYAGGQRPRDLMIQDYNGDGKPDFAFFQRGFPHLWVYLNQGAALFPAEPSGKYPVANTASPFGAAAGDLDGDGKPDLLASSVDNGRVIVVRNNGDGTFANTGGVAYATLLPAAAIAVADLSGDGKPDAVVAHYEQDQVRVLPNQGAASFAGGGAAYPGVAGPSALAVADLNGDGRLDLAVAAEAADSVTVLLNQGAGLFPAMGGTAYQVGRRPAALAAGDLDGDGSPDMAVVSQFRNTVGLLRGRSDGSFAPGTVDPALPAGAGPAGVFMADLNQDGRPDLVVTLAAVNSVAVLLRQ